MKRILLVTSLCLLASFSFAQKKAVKDAKSAMKNDISKARAAIKPALTDPETANDPDTWKLAGDIEFKAFDDERTKEMTKDLNQGKGGNEEKMYEGLYNMYDPYIKADELGQIPDEKGKIKNKHRKDIIKNLKDAHNLYINGGIYYDGKKEYKKATDFFVRYWELPTLPIFAEDKEPFNTQDSTYQTIKYYAVVSAINSKDHERTISLLNKLISEPYIQNSTYKESDPYELLVTQYQEAKDSLNYVKALNDAVKKFPTNKYFTINLINEYIRGGKTGEALAYLDQAIANDPENKSDLYSVKGSLYAEQKEYKDAEAAYQSALAADANFERALEGMGVLYVLQAQDLKELAGKTTNRKEQADYDKEAADFYLKSLPYLEKHLEILKAKGADNYDIRPALVKLQNVYYNLSLLKVDKSNELKDIDSQLEAIK